MDMHPAARILVLNLYYYLPTTIASTHNIHVVHIYLQCIIIHTEIDYNITITFAFNYIYIKRCYGLHIYNRRKRSYDQQ